MNVRSFWKAIRRRLRSPDLPGTDPLSYLRGRHLKSEVRPLFILSTGRTGTTTIVALFGLSPEILAFHEPRPWLAGDLQRSWFVNRQILDRSRGRLLRARAGPVAHAHRAGKRFVERTMLVPFTPVLADEFPGASFLHLIRHPGDVVVSGMRRGWYDGHPWDHLRPGPPQGHPDYQKWTASWTPFHKCCWLWNFINRRIVEWCRPLNERAWLIRFEDLIRPETGACIEIFERLKLRPPPLHEMEALLATPRNKQRSGSFAEYGDWSPEQREIMLDMCGATMGEVGYAE